MKTKMFANKSLLLAINSSYERAIKKLNKDLKKFDCNFLQALILISIFFEKDQLVIPSMISETFRTSKSNVSHAISALEKNEYVRRRTSQHDSRKWEILLKPKGEEIIKDLVYVIDSYESLFEDLLGKNECLDTVNRLHNVYQSLK